MNIKLGVIFGGETVEHEVSIITAVQAMSNINKDKYDVIPIYISKDKRMYTGNLLMDIENYQDMDNIKKYAKEVILYKRDNKFVLQAVNGLKRIVNEIDLALPIVHGSGAEDGTLQGFLANIGIPFVGSDIYGSVVGQDKIYQKDIFRSNGIPVTNYVWFYDTDYIKNKSKVIKDIEKLGYPVIIKPAKQGSSVGITVASKIEELVSGIEEAMKYDSKILVEEVVNNLKEVNISVMGNYDIQKLSQVEEVITKNTFLTYEDKYVSGGKGKSGKLKGMASTDRKIPADIDEKLKNEIEEIALKVFRVLGLSGLCRLDFLIDSKKNKVYINEPNTIPGSLAFYLWDESYSDLLDEMIQLAIKDYKNRLKKTYSFDTNILSNFHGLKGSKGLKSKLR